MLITIGPTGHIITGDVLDSSRKHLERKLRDYDSQLYVVWNPNKLKGWGCWEIRRRPSKKTAVKCGTFNGATIFELKFVENNFEHHVLDLPYLNYEVLTKLKQIDAWADKRWIDSLEDKEKRHKSELEDKARKEAVYNMKQNRHFIKAWREMLQSGLNPSAIAAHWK
jgi:hypothetical protein